VHTIHTPYESDLNPNLYIGDLKARQAR
jgi:hypothetical protein